MAHGLEVRAPFLDKAFLQNSLKDGFRKGRKILIQAEWQAMVMMQKACWM
jgi:hypothetical protein